MAQRARGTLARPRPRPDKHLRLRAEAPRGPAGRAGLLDRPGAQIVIDDEGVDRPSVLPADLGEQVQERGGIPAPRQAEDQRPVRAERAAARLRGLRIEAQQPARAASRRALRRASSSAFGNSASKLSSTPQASATWSIAASEAARRTSASGERGPERSARSEAR